MPLNDRYSTCLPIQHRLNRVREWPWAGDNIGTKEESGLTYGRDALCGTIPVRNGTNKASCGEIIPADPRENTPYREVQYKWFIWCRLYKMRY